MREQNQHYCSLTGLFSLFFVHCELKIFLPNLSLPLGSQVLKRDGERKVSPESLATADEKKIQCSS